MNERVTQSDVEVEKGNVTQLLRHGTHRHIVEILRHDPLPDGGYYIDMVLCGFSLRAYIKHHHQWPVDSIASAAREDNTSSIMVKYESRVQKMRNVWVIGVHISRGLEFLHSYGQTHRDLKPENSIIHPSCELMKFFMHVGNGCLLTLE